LNKRKSGIENWREMASKAKKVIEAPMATAQRLLWEKYNKPNRNLFEALSAFEGHGIGRKVVCFNCPL
jgi:hypothetical protein